MGLLLGGHWDLAPCIYRGFVIDFLIGGHIYVAELDDGKMIACAMWSGPGEAMLKEYDSMAYLWMQEINEMFFQRTDGAGGVQHVHDYATAEVSGCGEVVDRIRTSRLSLNWPRN